MSRAWIISLLTALYAYQSADGTYHYAGCYARLFRDSFFSSSFMEPRLCFRLCDTPIVYLQGTFCRCSGGGLMNYNRQDDAFCPIVCPKLANRRVQETVSCGGLGTYSAYVESAFYIRHGHLFNYQIQFSACELWTKPNIYDIKTVDLNHLVIQSSLNRLERCAAACLDLNILTKSIAFGSNESVCICILPWTPTVIAQRDLYVSIQPNNTCDNYCNNTLVVSGGGQIFHCGSLKDPNLRSIYSLIGACPSNFTYIQELNKCVHAYQYSWNSCPSPSTRYVYDGNVTWSVFLKIIDRLKLNDTVVTVNFAESIIVDASMKCAVDTSTSSSYLYISNWNSITRYVLENGCLRETHSWSMSHRYAHHLCVADMITKYSSTDADEYSADFISERPATLKFCPEKWMDLNGRCYRMSSERKSIQEARSSCINVSAVAENSGDKSHSWSQDDDDDDDDDEEEDDRLSGSLKGDIAQYTAQWQARFGFFLLDIVPQNDVGHTTSSTSTFGVYYENPPSSYGEFLFAENINDFQMISPVESKNVSTINDSCLISTRTAAQVQEKPMLETVATANCSQPKHVLCETKSLIARSFDHGCFRKPLTMDLPALISASLTHGLCFTACRDLDTSFAVIHINKCYCFDGHASEKFNLTTDLGQYQRNTCGNPCSGNRNEQCGDEETIIVFRIVQPRYVWLYTSAPVQTSLDFQYDSCIQASPFDLVASYHFQLNNTKNHHPRHCLQLCIKHKQKYALISSDRCLCTNLPLKTEANGIRILVNQNCSQQCSANYFYTCGHPTNPQIYSLYVLQAKCRHGFELAENGQQCVYSHVSRKTDSFSSARAQCRALGGEIARIDDMLELQDILPDSVTRGRLWTSLSSSMMNYAFLFTKYFWIDRGSRGQSNGTLPDRLLEKCPPSSEATDRNCLVIAARKISNGTLDYAERCIAESNDCSTNTAIPVCVDQHLEDTSLVVSPWTGDKVSASVSLDYSCGDQADYHFIEEYCYKVSLHEVSWNEARSVCARENASIFVPERSATLRMMKFFFSHRTSYTSSGFAHVGVIYDRLNRTVAQYNSSNEKVVPDSNTVYDTCAATFQTRYAALIESTSLSADERNQIQSEPMGCGYVDLASNLDLTIRCDDIPCRRTAAVICQKLPVVKIDMVIANREKILTPMDADSISGSSDSSRSIGRDYAPIFFVLGILSILLVLGLIKTLYVQRLFPNLRKQATRTTYSQLSSNAEFDLT